MSRALTETFAHLPVGLGVFDADGRLTTFNPAFADLTGIEPGVLIARPRLSDLLDRLREARVLPEPRNWSAWRDGIARLEAGARDGTLLQSWDLPDGRSWRVSGRPHPGGAAALLIEDVSDSVDTIRLLRAELELGQAVADSLDEAVAVFSAQGVLVLSNAAYARLWGTDPRQTLGDACLSQARLTWRARGGDEEAWRALDAALAPGARRGWQGAVPRAEGSDLRVRTVALPRGGVLVGFRPSGEEDGAEADGAARESGGGARAPMAAE
ncbi:PAS-domain containing protein [Hasllibacter halocynthiae]|uniref:PAS-domain containing protein n=1 Tax=Hasllibacter halocynthiae TaxID=595589 RepID=UPI00130504B3|nr:PAS-domain containing protein [Hasllibacter halocynthiae]